MAKDNVTESVIRSQFKDYVSARERLLICGINCDVKNSLVMKLRPANKNDGISRRHLLRSKTVLA